MPLELKFVFLMTKLTLILILNDHHDAKPDIKVTITELNLTLTDPHDAVALLVQYLCRFFDLLLFRTAHYRMILSSDHVKQTTTTGYYAIFYFLGFASPLSREGREASPMGKRSLKNCSFLNINCLVIAPIMLQTTPATCVKNFSICICCTQMVKKCNK